MSVSAGQYIPYNMNFKNSSFLGHRLGYCEVVISDQGREFDNAVQKELFQCTGTNHKVLYIVHHPQTNDLTERFNQTLQASLIKLDNSN